MSFLRSLGVKCENTLDWLLGIYNDDDHKEFRVVSPDLAKANPPKKEPEKIGLTIEEIQQELNEHFDAKLKVDGKLGAKTMSAIRSAEMYMGFFDDGYPDVDFIRGLLQLHGLVKDITPTTLMGDTKNPDFKSLWETCEISPDRIGAIRISCANILKGEARYRWAERMLGIPWQIVGIIHKMECGCDFSRHMHNGDPLTARTVQVPKGRPIVGTPPFTWEESCLDALNSLKGKKWDIVSTLEFLERYNGLGYRNKGIYSPYLWSYSNHYIKGKYVADGVYDPNAVSKQCGVACMLKVLKYAA